jgi:hypothetical protein
LIRKAVQRKRESRTKQQQKKKKKKKPYSVRDRKEPYGSWGTATVLTVFCDRTKRARHGLSG